MHFPGEEKLKCLYEELKKADSKIDTRCGYNADSIIRVMSLAELEILITEVSSRFKKIDKTKHASDHYKGMFGLLAMMRGIVKYNHASLSTFQSIKVFFIRAYYNSLYLWSMKYVGNDLYCLFKEKKVEIPFSFNNKGDNLFNYILFANEIKHELEATIEKIMMLKEEHEDNLRRRRYSSRNEYEDTLDLIIKPNIIKVSTIRGYTDTELLFRNGSQVRSRNYF